MLLSKITIESCSISLTAATKYTLAWNKKENQYESVKQSVAKMFEENFAYTTVRYARKENMFTLEMIYGTVYVITYL